MAGAVSTIGNLPDPLEKREILYSPETPRQELIAYGEAFLESGLAMDALDFFVQARSDEHLQRFLADAIEAGDLFTFEKCLRGLGRNAEPPELEALGRNADAKGLHRFAQRARGETPTEPAENDENED